MILQLWYCIIYIVALWVILFSANRKRIQNWKQQLLIWNDMIPFPLFMYIHHSLASVALLFKHKSISLLTWVCSFNILVGSFLYFTQIVRDQPRRCTYFGAKLAFIGGIFLKKYPSIVWRFISSSNSWQLQVYQPLLYS